MANALANGRLTNGKRQARREDEIDRRIKPISLEGVHQALQKITHGTVRRDRLESRDRAYRWAVRKAFGEGNPFRSTLAQAAAGMGYPVTGDPRQDSCTHQAQVRRCLNDLQDAGLIQWGGIKRANGQWRCIEVRVLDNERQRTIMYGSTTSRRSHRSPSRKPLDACPGGRRHRYRTASSARRIFFTASKMTTPLRGVSSPSDSQLKGETSRARGAPGRSPRWQPPPQKNSSQEGSARPAEPAGRAALLERFAALFGEPRFSHRQWGDRLDRALARLDRYADFGTGRSGAGVEFALNLLEATAEDSDAFAPCSPASLAYFVPILDSISKEWRRAHRPRIRAARAAAKKNAAAPRRAAAASGQQQQEESSHVPIHDRARRRR